MPQPALTQFDGGRRRQRIACHGGGAAVGVPTVVYLVAY